MRVERYLKKTVCIFFIFFFLLSFSLAFAKSDSAVAQEKMLIQETSVTPSPIEKDKKVEYELPYPGLLPDSPLYSLKAFRDAIIGFLISDPLKKANFYLLQADKRLSAGLSLIENKKNYSLAESTISKGENYFEKAIGKVQEAKTQGMDIKDIASRLLTSSKKHQEVIANLIKNADAKTKGSFESLLKRAQGFEKRVEALIPK